MLGEIEKNAIACLNNVGIALEYTGVDFNLSDLEMDSIQFISYIVELENYFSIEFPDELLSSEKLSSFYALAQIIEELQKDKSDALSTKGEDDIEEETTETDHKPAF